MKKSSKEAVIGNWYGFLNYNKERREIPQVIYDKLIEEDGHFFPERESHVGYSYIIEIESLEDLKMDPLKLMEIRDYYY